MVVYVCVYKTFYAVYNKHMQYLLNELSYASHPIQVLLNYDQSLA